MPRFDLVILVLTTASLLGQPPVAPRSSPGDLAFAGVDWLVRGVPRSAGAWTSADGRELHLANGLVRRTFRLAPDLACVALEDLRTGRSLLRAVRPEARLVLDGNTVNVGGLVGQPNHAYLLPAWLETMRPDPAAAHFVGYRLGRPKRRFPWKRVRPHAPDVVWPPAGVALELDFVKVMPASAGQASGTVRIVVHYELYDGVPVFAKWLTVHNGLTRPLEIDRIATEILAVVEDANPVEHRIGVPLPAPDTIHVETDYAMGGFKHAHANRWTVHWRPDPQYMTQVNWARQMPCLLEVEPTRGPDVIVEPGKTFTSFRTFELLHDDDGDRERRGLALRRLYRTVAPWVTENPLILHVVSTRPDVVRRAIDQAETCGFEMVSLSFGSGLNMEDARPANLEKFKALAEYATGKGIHLGGYSLLSSRRIGNGQNVVSPPGEKPAHGACPALTSQWGQEYFKKLRAFFEHTGFLQFTHDGSYPGDFDVTPRPPLQRGLDDSQWAQWNVICEFYRWLRGRGVYLRVPDYYYLQGGNECGMGYREVNWSLPRAQQVIHTRQNIYDGTWTKTPSMGWMFVPLTQYHGGGAAATIEPLDAHRDHYRRMLDSNLALGVQAVYRGHRLYDTDATRDLVRDRVTWFKRHRHILESDLVHGRRANGKDVDWMLHVNPKLDEKGMLVVFNPLVVEAKRTLRVPLYYTGLSDRARITGPDGKTIEHELGRDYAVTIDVVVPAGGMAAYLIR
ncbi:MAG: alpha-galactosidase [Planctomycetes bacterium]|nr:alpha-galactosidase [Planctomycetota bacterium]